MNQTTRSNDTLKHGLCTSFENSRGSYIADDVQATVADTFVPTIQARLSFALGVHLTHGLVPFQHCCFHHRTDLGVPRALHNRGVELVWLLRISQQVLRPRVGQFFRSNSGSRVRRRAHRKIDEEVRCRSHVDELYTRWRLNYLPAEQTNVRRLFTRQ